MAAARFTIADLAALAALDPRTIRAASALLITRYARKGRDILREIVEEQLRDPRERPRMMRLAVRVLLSSHRPLRELTPVGRGPSRSLQEATERTFSASPELLRDLVREGLRGRQAAKWRRIGLKFGVGLEEQARLCCLDQRENGYG